VHLLASDLATSGFAPQYGIFDFNLPPTMGDSEFSKYWGSFHEECSRIGLAIVGGHTGRYQGCDYTIIGGGFLYSIGSENRYLTSSMAEVGDEIIVTKGVAIETTAILTRVFPRKVRKALGSKLFRTAWGYLKKVTTVKDALTAVEVGVREKGVTAMHDATEGGFMAAVMELAAASGLGVEVDLESIPISQETIEICKLFQINPLTSLSEGSLLISCKPDRTTRLLNRLKSEGIRSHVIGRLTPTVGLAYGTSRRGRIRLEYPTSDPYWAAYWRAVEKRWS
jgi:hydrogenase expression/formation protein HypE